MILVTISALSLVLMLFCAALQTGGLAVRLTPRYSLLDFLAKCKSHPVGGCISEQWIKRRLNGQGATPFVVP
jgi:hypothetical protein